MIYSQNFQDTFLIHLRLTDVQAFGFLISKFIFFCNETTNVLRNQGGDNSCGISAKIAQLEFNHEET